MWPLPGDALSRTIEVEAALTDLYAEALNEWVVGVIPAVLPTLDHQVHQGEHALVADAGDSLLEPDPDAVLSGDPGYNPPLMGIIPGISVLWCISLIETFNGLGFELPGTAGYTIPPVSQAIIRAITSTSDVTPADLTAAVSRVESVPSLRQARDDYLDAARPMVARTPMLVRDRVAAAVGEAALSARRSDEAVDVKVVITRQREAAAAVLRPGSADLRDIARHQGYQAAGIQNSAVLEAARHSPTAVLEKTWICTIDGKTRDTHFAADGQRAPLDGTFTVGGAALKYPGDPGGPPQEVYNCRCRMGILAPDEDIPDEVDRHTERLDGRDSVQIHRQGTQRDEINRRAERGVIRARDDEDGLGRTAAVTATIEGTDTMAENQFRTFTDQPVAFIGVETSDGRMLAPDIDLSFRTFPLPIMWCRQTGNGHEEAFTVGVIESARVDGNRVLASGYLLNTPEADEAAEQLGHTVTRPSVDLARAEWILTDADGNEISEEEWWDLPMDAVVIQTITAAELIGTTLVATPAFGDTMLVLDEQRQSRDVAVVASATETFTPRVYDANLFTDPQLTEPTPVQMDPDTGRIFGHLACFGTCHRSIQSQCVMAPRSRSNYAHFHTSPPVRLNNGTTLPVGRLTVGTGHAPDTMPGHPAQAHYDNTGTCFALVRAGEDEHGIWVSGVAAPWATAEQIEMGLSSPLSGDWRDFGQGLELIAALAVNTPGFAVRGRDGADGRPAALVAAIGPDPRSRRGAPTLTAANITTIVETAVRNALEAQERRRTAAELLAAAKAKVGPPPTPPTPNEQVGELLAQAGQK